MSMLFVCTVYPQALTFTSARAPWPFDQHAGAPLRQAALPTLVGVPETARRLTLGRAYRV